MIKRVTIPKTRIYPTTRYDDIIRDKKINDVELMYYEFSEIDLLKLVMFDGVDYINTYAPFKERLPKCGKPFCLAVNTEDGERVAFAGIIYSDENADMYKTISQRDDFYKVANDKFYASVPITSGICCFASEIVYSDYLFELKNGDNPLASVVKNGNNLHMTLGNLAAFSCGWGEGSYNVFAGIGLDGKVNKVIADFGMFPTEEDESDTITVEIDVDITDAYEDNPKLSKNENAIAKQTLILSMAEDDETRFNAYLYRANVLRAEKRNIEAIADYQCAIDIGVNISKIHSSSKLVYAFENAAEAAIEVGDQQKAIEILKREVETVDTMNSNAYNKLIQLLLEDKLPREALNIAEKIVVERPLDANAYYRLADVYMDLQQLDKAADCYEVLVKKFALTDSVFDRVACLMRLDRVDEAAQSLDDYIKTSPPNEFFYTAYANIYMRRHDTVNAYKYAVAAYSINNQFMPALHLLIECDERRLDYDEILIWSGKYLERRPLSAFGYLEHGWTLARLADFDGAIKNYERALTISYSPKIISLNALMYLLNREKSKVSKILKRLHAAKEMSYYTSVSLIDFMMRKSDFRRKHTLSTCRWFSSVKVDDDFLLFCELCFADINCFEAVQVLTERLSKSRDTLVSCEANAIMLMMLKRTGRELEFTAALEDYVALYSTKENHDVFRQAILTSTEHLSKIEKK